MLKQVLTQKQKLKISQQNIQLFKMLELNSMQFDEKLKEELDSNPSLILEDKNFDDYSIVGTNDLTITNNDNSIKEISNEFIEPNSTTSSNFDFNDQIINDIGYSDDDYHVQMDISNRISTYSNQIDEDNDNEIPIADNISIYNSIKSQFSFLNISENEKIVGEYIIGNIDNNGFLRREISNIVDDLAFRHNFITTEDFVNSVLLKIKMLDPAGIGAKDIQECLILQLKRKPEDNIRNIAIYVLENYLDQFAKHQHLWLCKKLKIKNEEFEKVITLIKSLNPSPIIEENKNEIGKYIIPDFFIYRKNSKLNIELHQKNSPNLTINEDFISTLKNLKELKNKKKSEKDAIFFLKDKLTKAQELITTIKQRQETMIIIASYIVNYQIDFFNNGSDSEIKPLILKTVSENTNFDISTISRVVNSKYIQTEFGIYSLRFFFSESIISDDGDEISTKKVKSALKKIIDVEDNNNPFSDIELTEMLKEKGFSIARRTTAKYRQQLNISPKHLRKIN